MRIVLDTNVIISGLFWRGIPGKILENILRGKYILCFSEETWREFQKVLNYPKFKSQIQELPFPLEEFLNKLTEKAIIVYSPNKLDVIKEHPADNKFLSCAISCGASFIISGDKHLLQLKKFQDISILTPREFLKKFTI